MTTKNITEIINWAKESLLAKGYIINNSPETIQTTPWSSVTRFLTSKGTVYLKQTPPMLSLEPTVTKILHDQLHANVPEVLDSNKNLNCFLIKDSGSSLREILKHNFQPDLLCQAIKKYTYIQAAAREHINTFLEIGVPDWRLEKLPLLYNELIGKEDLLKADGLTVDELKLLHELYPTFLSICEMLSNYKISQTLDHCDFHDNNILIENNTHNITIIDWGETVITHPFFSLLTFLNTAARHYTLKETDLTYNNLQNICFENWFEVLPKNNLVAAIFLAKKLWPVYAALGFYRLTISSEPEEFKSIASRLSGYLKEFIKANTTKINFKKFVQPDLALFFEWAKKPHVKDTWFIDGYESIDKYSEKIKGNGYDYSFIIYIDDKPIGYIQCSDLYAYKTLCPKPKGIFVNEEPGTFCVDLFIGEEEYLNKGYGTEIVKLFIGKLFTEFKAKKILIDPACSNKRAIRCYEKAGFKFFRKEYDGVTESCVMEFASNES